MEVNTPHQRLRTSRIAKGFANAKTFAMQHGLSYTTYISHENGKVPLSEKAANNYAKILKIPVSWLLYGEVTASDSPQLTGNIASIYLRRKALEPVILPMLITAILKIVGKYDKSIDYNRLLKKSYVIMSEILAKTDDLDEIESHISAIVTLEKEALLKSILKELDNK